MKKQLVPPVEVIGQNYVVEYEAEEQRNGETTVLEEHGGDEIGMPKIFGRWMTVTRTNRIKNQVFKRQDFGGNQLKVKHSKEGKTLTNANHNSSFGILQNIGEDSEHVTSLGNNEVVLVGWTTDPTEPLVSNSIDGKRAIMDRADWRPMKVKQGVTNGKQINLGKGAIGPSNTQQFNNLMFNYSGVSGGSFNRSGLRDVGLSSVHRVVANDPTGGSHTNPIGKKDRIESVILNYSSGGRGGQSRKCYKLHATSIIAAHPLALGVVLHLRSADLQELQMRKRGLLAKEQKRKGLEMEALYMKYPTSFSALHIWWRCK
ncbi:uncharacterized protein G2W53_033254 [Senna tora]|uniref:Uncharacterized protein n=1 Tax=Senna tora TaxID=362788 RepID=A0A834SYX3_9FABA|nr:uncharacterized protein G2W53_033254 [Senna tora]